MISSLLEKNLLPDWLIRLGIRRLLAQRLRDEEAAGAGRSDSERLAAFASQLRGMPVAINSSDSRTQHYEVPTPFYQSVLGPRLKYSCCWYEKGDESLAEGEEAMLRLYEQRARLEDGQQILELGCGWGSLSLWLAARFPKSSITGVSHSRTQKLFIDAAAARLGLQNLTIITCDMNDFDIAGGSFDRVVSVEMFEHMKNWPVLLSRIAAWLRPGGLFFMHIFTHHRLAYHFVERDESDWMSRHFFTGGMMPADKLLPCFQESLQLCGHWQVEGRHYQRTAEQWLQNMDQHREPLMQLLSATYGPAETTRWWVYWRVFFMSCAELWGYRKGQEWIVSHYLLSKP